MCHQSSFLIITCFQKHMGEPKEARYTMKLSKHGNQLVSASSSEHSDSNMHFQEVWDLTLRKCIQKGSFESNREILGSSTWGLLDCGRYVLVSDWQSLRMCTIDCKPGSCDGCSRKQSCILGKWSLGEASPNESIWESACGAPRTYS